MLMQAVLYMIVVLELISGSTIGPGKDIAGTYIRRSPNEKSRKFDRSITLSCDFSVIATFQGVMEKETTDGHWTLVKDTLVVKFDRNERARHWAKEEVFLVRRKKLIQIITSLNGEPIADKDLQNAILKDGKQFPFVMEKREKCD
jgi:hypothetical protein